MAGVIRKPAVPDPLVELSLEMSEDGLFVPQSSITIQNIIGEGKNALLVKIIIKLYPLPP